MGIMIISATNHIHRRDTKQVRQQGHITKSLISKTSGEFQNDHTLKKE